MRPPKITVITHEEYITTYSPSICAAVRQILLNPDKVDFSQEELCRGIYNVCCQRHGPVLYENITHVIVNYLTEMANYMATVPDNTILNTILSVATSFRKSVSVIQNTFRYLEKTHVQDKMRTTLDQEYIGHFKVIVLNPLTPVIANKLTRKPLPIDPTTCMNLVKLLYELDTDYIKINPQLFALYIPQLFTSRGPEADFKETNEFFSQKQNQDLGNSGQQHKRKFVSTSF